MYQQNQCLTGANAASYMADWDKMSTTAANFNAYPDQQIYIQMEVQHPATGNRFLLRSQTLHGIHQRSSHRLITYGQ